MALHFTTSEFERRKELVCKAMHRDRLDGMLLFQQESMYWLTGYDTFGFCFFQCLYMGRDGRMALLTRAPDLRQAEQTSNIEDIRIWVDSAAASPADQLRDMLDDLGVRGARLGIEAQTVGLTFKNGVMVTTALRDFCTLQDASSLVDRERLVKSAEEMAYVRKAGELADAALKAGVEATHAGADEGAILAVQQAAVFEGGGDYAGNEFIIGSGRDALLCRYKSGRRVLESNDQITFELAGVYRHYHAALMRTPVIGRPTEQHLRMHAACVAALEAVEGQLRPGKAAGDVFKAHASAMDAHGMQPHRLNACGYSLGASFTPCWMDYPMFYADNPELLAADMVFFAHMILMDSESGNAQCLGRTYILTEGAPEPLSTWPLEMIVR